MNKLILLIASVYFIFALSIQAISQNIGTGASNLGFETWIPNQILGEQLDGWVVINGEKDGEDVLEGDYSLYLETGNYLVLGLQPGMATIGKFQSFNVLPGEPYGLVPNYVIGNVKYNLLENDTALFSVQLTQFYEGNTTVIASADTMFAGAQDNWTNFALQFQWDTWGVPDSIQIAITSGGNSDLIGYQIGTLTAGSWLKADNFMLTNSVNIDDLKTSNNKILMFPNPCKDILHIKNAENSLVNIYNLLGQKLLTTKLYNNEIINISKLSPGNYIIEFTKGNFTEVKKLNIIR
ncbi:MAG TPA: T9SS type A sorting domain-containing protein [Bacteroidales bacterium]|jgi:hypothetical protein|nr:T9SS type A sorting domain-containing protein [Bacteroidales bacterium]HRW21606.1 T9SS type A sorting domain-containing protein [Bacteroidales bacterium]